MKPLKRNHYTIRMLMARTGLTYPGASSLIRRMREKGLAQLSGEVIVAGTTKAFVYSLSLDPEEYLRGVRLPSPSLPKSTHYNDPFNLGAQHGR